MEPRAFYERVAARAHLDSPHEAREVTHHVLRSLAACLDRDLLERLQAALPNDLVAGLAGVRAGADEYVDSQVFIGPLVQAMDTEYLYDQTIGGLDLNSAYRDDDASLCMRAVFATLREQLDPHLAAALRDRLPPELRDWWESGA